MCGIAGFLDLRATPAPGVASRMTGAIRHRGPDDDGHYCDPRIAMGMRRLSIIDVAGGHQPIPNEDESLWIVYNGEVFNHAAVREQLEAAGHRYRTRSDTETILHAFEEYGEECVQRFRGMFAFAIWDSRRQRLFLARDRLGIKPLYYWWNGTTLAFASEIKALFAHPEIAARLNESAIPEYVAFGYTSAEETLFAGVRKLMPGHFLWLDASRPEPRLNIRRYWDAPFPQPGEPRPDSEWIAECRQRLEETVRMRLMSDVPLGMFLSGGVDSSAIAALVSRMIPKPLETFSVGYAESEYSELGYAAQAAAYLKTKHAEVRIGMDEFFGALPRLIWQEDEPISWPSSVSLYFVSRLAAQHVKVVLTGEGSDELFAGYERYRHQLFNEAWMRRYRIVPGPLRQWLRRQVAVTPLLSADLRRKVGHTFLGRAETVESLYLDNFYCGFSQEEMAALRPGRNGANPYEAFRAFWDRVPAGLSPLARMLYADQKTYLVELLMKQDQMSMACSIESRVPFLDHTFVEFAARVPDHLKIRDGVQKYILKKAVEDLLPHEIVHRRKMGFPTPLRRWFRSAAAGPLFDRLIAPQSWMNEHFQRGHIAGLIARQQSGAEDATDRLWRLLNLQLWGDIFLTGKPLEPPPA